MDAPLRAFADAAQAYVRWCESAPADAPTETLAAQRQLATLHTLALDLSEPDDAPEVEGERVPHDAWTRVYERGRALALQYYWCVDTTRGPAEETPEPDLGDLSDDLADIYLDLAEGLALLRAGHVESARWHWAWSFRTHWGQHAVEALGALHAWWRAHAGRT